MNFLPARKKSGLGIFSSKRYLLILFFLLGLLFFNTTARPVFADLGSITPAPTIPFDTTSKWAFDPDVTELGKNADRSRQLLFWTLKNPGIHYAPVIAQIWAVSRDIVLGFIVLVILAFGLGLILTRRKGIGAIFSGISSPVMGLDIPLMFFKLIILLLYAALSYLLILGLIQTSEVIMKFFIESVGGPQLFNVFFAGKNLEQNYTTFVGYSDINILNRESVRTSMYLIRMTSMTYNAMAIIVILRTIILWFLLVVSPFLAILMPFVFIRNIGWIWIGVFFQWLFYGPLMYLFLAALVKIWISGIPYPFDFTRVNTRQGQIYPTAINILYGGPAQTLSAGNSANYIDTYAEYVISLIMLWAAVILPWFLLRIFRDYCCDAIAAGNATLTSIFDRLRQSSQPPPGATPAGPVTTSGISLELPFRGVIEEKVHEVSKTNIENVKEISQASTSEIIKSENISVTSLKDVSRYDINRDVRSNVETRFDKISSPENIASSLEKQRYSILKNELMTRASKGDVMAKAMLNASERDKEVLISQMESLSSRRLYDTAALRRQDVFAPSIPSVLPNSFSVSSSITQQAIIASIAQKTGVAESKVSQVLKSIPAAGLLTQGAVSSISKHANISESKVQEIVNAAASSMLTTQAPSQTVLSASKVTEVSQKTGISETKVRDVMATMSTVDLTSSSAIATISQKTSLSESKVQEVVSSVTSLMVHETLASSSSISTISQQTGVSETKVREVLQTMSTTGVPASSQSLAAISQQTNISESKVEEIVRAATTPVAVAVSAVSPAVVTQVSQKTGISETKVREVLQTMSTTGISTSQVISTVSKHANISESKVQEIVNAAASSMLTTQAPSQTVLSAGKVTEVSQKTGISETKVRDVMATMSAVDLTSSSAIATISQKTSLSESKVQEVVSQIVSSTASATATATSTEVPGLPPTVSIDDYEEVKSMWLKHYRFAPVPISDKIKSRQEWISEETTKLTNIYNLLSSSNSKLKRKGLEEVAEILPFMLLGGFSDLETLIYIKAKLEAAKQIQEEEKIGEKAKNEAKKELEEEDSSLIEIKDKKQDEQEEKVLSAEKELEIPEKEQEEKNKDKENKAVYPKSKTSA